jgi:phage major head subunit gpT-like protein
MQISQGTLAALFRGYHTLYQDAYQAANPMWPSVAMETGSASAEEIYFWLGAFPTLEKFLGDANIQNLTGSKYAIANDEYQSIIGIKRADIERDKFGLYNPILSTMGRVAKYAPDPLVANLLLNGFAQNDYTGSPFFSANKVQDQSGPIKLTNNATYALSANSFSAARAAMRSYLNSQGRPLGVGEKIQLVVPPQLETLGKQILQADLIAQTALNSDAVVVGVAAVSNVQKGAAELAVWPQLATQPAYWFLLDVSWPVKPVIMQFEVKPEFTSLVAPGDAHVFTLNEFLYKSYGRWNAGYGLPQLAFGSTGTSAAL